MRQEQIHKREQLVLLIFCGSFEDSTICFIVLYNFLQDMKVVMLEDLASHFKLKTQVSVTGWS